MSTVSENEKMILYFTYDDERWDRVCSLYDETEKTVDILTFLRHVYPFFMAGLDQEDIRKLLKL